MKIISPSAEIINILPGEEILKSIERAGRVCYKSEDKIKEKSAEGFVRAILKSRHESVIEHASATVLFICDRGVTHEIVRHRIASYSQESTRYCRYNNDKFGNEITVIKPLFYQEGTKEYNSWRAACQACEHVYLDLLSWGSTAQEARSVLPNSLKTELVATLNMRAWRHFFKLRTPSDAHPQMREIVIPLLEKFKAHIPVLFEDINV